MLIESGKDEDLQLAQEIRDVLHAIIVNLDKERFQVKMALEFMDVYKHRDKWNNLSVNDIHLIETHLSKLPPPFIADEKQRRFTLLMTNLQIASLLDTNPGPYHDKLLDTATILSGKYTIPEVAMNKALITEMKNPDFYVDLSQQKLEQIRVDIGVLMKYLETDDAALFYTDLTDSNVEIVVNEPGFKPASGGIYKERVAKFIRENKDHLVIHKLFANKPITIDELQKLEDILFDGADRGTREDFTKEFGEQPLGAFIRSILGLDVVAANEAFTNLIQKSK